MARLKSYLRLMRPANCIMMGFAVVVGAALASPNEISKSALNLIYGFVTGFMLTAASMAINDYYDRDIDAINEPKRPIPSGLVKPREALIFALFLVILGFGAACLTNFPSLILATFAWCVFFTYSTVGKRTGFPGNVLVSLCVAIPFIYGSFAVANSLKLNVLVFASMAFLSNTGREITKGIVDVEGDRAQNVKTLTVRYGAKSAATAAAIAYLFAVLLSPVPWFWGLVSFWFIPLVAVTDIGLVASSLMIVRNYSRENARKIKRGVLAWSAVGLLAFIVGALW